MSKLVPPVSERGFYGILFKVSNIFVFWGGRVTSKPSEDAPNSGLMVSIILVVGRRVMLGEVVLDGDGVSDRSVPGAVPESPDRISMCSAFA